MSGEDDKNEQPATAAEVKSYLEEAGIKPVWVPAGTMDRLEAECGDDMDKLRAAVKKLIKDANK
jgi:protein tyrosine phosphatase (PTP) superfamily phosphohydrolase (DUF442 family)